MNRFLRTAVCSITLAGIVFWAGADGIGQNACAVAAPGLRIAAATTLSEQEQKELREEAGRLAEDFKALFKDISQATKTIIGSVIDRTAQWIDQHYAELSEKNRKRLKELLKDLEEDYKNLKDMSVEALGDILEELKEFIKEFGDDKAAPQKQQEDRTYI